MKTQWGSGSIDQRILNFELGGGDWSATRPYRFTPGTHWIGDWVGPRAGLDSVAERKMPFTCLVTILTELSRLQSLLCI